jgi:large subunit ribosomal protein L10
MTKDEKNKIIDSLVDSFNACSNFYVTDIATLNSEKTSKLRRLCYTKNIKINVAKNTLIKQALQKIDPENYKPLFPAFKGTSAIMFSETANLPAKLIKEFRRESDRPILKGAYIESSVFMGDNQLDALVGLKSKNELIGDIIGLLQSPAKNVLGALQSGGNKLAGIVKTLENRAS